MTARIYTYTYAQEKYFIYWIMEKNTLGVTDGGSVVYEGEFSRSLRSETLKIDLTEAAWNKLFDERAFRITSISFEELVLSRGIKEFTLKKLADPTASLKRIFSNLASAVEEVQKKEAAPPPVKKTRVVGPSPRKMPFPIKMKRRSDSDDEFIPLKK